MAASPRQDRVAGIVLAAGESRRLGRPKQLLDLCGEPMLRRVVRAALQSDLAGVTVVLGASADDLRAVVADLGVGIVINDEYHTGQASSIRAGLKSVVAQSGAVLFLLGDQPTLNPAMIDQAIRVWRAEQPLVVQARYRNGVGHPVLFDASLFPELVDVTGDRGARDVIRRHPDEVRYIESDEDAPPDIDTEADYKRVLDLIEPCGNTGHS